ncbi:MAG TPA: histidine phosphatase family protein [Chloroflexi bacterium]|jgi:2,3-bisphosphoglycerate-dependent phosphoglycerate mutase|nr:histidine phosphatase family protein [Chloroflexota bacterium]
MQLYFIRHGQSINNARWQDDGYSDHARESDPPLTETGVLQAQYAGEFLAQKEDSQKDLTDDLQNRYAFGLTHLYSSLMIRAVQTGTIISEKTGVPLTALPQVHEVGGVYLENVVNGVSEISLEYGGSPEFFARHFPNLQFYHPIESKGWWKGGREEDSAPMQRAKEVLNFLKECHLGSDDRVGVITHGGFYNYLVRVIFQIALEEPENRNLPYWYSFCNCALSRYDFNNNRVTLAYHNRTDFLPDELVTY